MLNIRYATKDDISSIVDFNCAMALETENKELDKKLVDQGVQSVLNNLEYGFYIVAENDGKSIGQLMITKEWSDWRNSEFWWIQSVYIHPEQRKNNIYKKLYKEVINTAKKLSKVCGVRLYVDKHNKVAQQVYASLGMTESNYLLLEDDWSNV